MCICQCSRVNKVFFCLDFSSGERLSKYTIISGATRKGSTTTGSTRLCLPHNLTKFARYNVLGLSDCAIAPKVLDPYPSWLPDRFALNASIVGHPYASQSSKLIFLTRISQGTFLSNAALRTSSSALFPLP